ncbi:natural killer cell receptor 2B4 [Terrapene carolina triunguis]|uniref:natural killer cell receptor 2B4 n=1 Tax=Terrapene triunguis TaxID=2587831 RepID=UPI000CEF5BAF|nr:natural killer cell receptor 2B4 [Terrapene carolina triunguis]
MEVAAIAGESVQLQPVKLPEPWAEMTWEVTLDSAQTYRIVTFNKGEPPDLGSSPHFINRVTFHPENLSLQIDPVKKSDSGLYTLQIDIGGGRVNITKFRVSVFERVRQRNLTVLSAHQELGQCNVTLSCSVPGTDRVTYRWSRGTSWIPSDRDHQLPGNQSLLHVVINADSSDIFYRCNASNRASWDTDTLDIKSLCDSPATDFFQKVPLWAIVAAGLGLLLLLTALTLIFLCKHRKKQRSSKDGDPPLTIYEEVEDARPRRNANGNAQSRIVGNTIYAEINCNPQVGDFTVYAAVQRPPSVKRKKINPSFISTIYTEVQEAPSRPRHPQKQRSSSPNPGHLYS